MAEDVSQLLTGAQVKKVVSYAESSDEDEPFKYGNSTKSRRATRARNVIKDEDEYDEEDAGDVMADDDDGKEPLAQLHGPELIS